MVYKLILTTFTLLTLATCQTEKTVAKSENETTTPTTSVVKEKVSIPDQVKTDEVSDVLPPDKESQENATQDVVNIKNGMVYLKEGENKFVKELGMNITFKKIVEDSRCPKDVNCVWAGVATAEIEVMGVETRPVTLKVSTLSQAGKYSRTQNFNGYDITLDQLSPETTSEKGMKALQGSYKIVLKINKGGGTPTR